MPQITEDMLTQPRHIHFIGIGGAGMYPLVQILHENGHTISGSDVNESDTVLAERAMGLDVHIGHDAANIDGADIVVYTAALLPGNPELEAAKACGIPVVERAKMLGLISARYDDCVAIAGTHGKTTTTAMLTQIYLDAELDPSAVIGGSLRSIGGNGRAGRTSHILVEACEFVDTFLDLDPAVSVILNIDEDHLDYFKTMDNLVASFKKFARLARKAVVYNADCERTRGAVEDAGVPLISFGSEHDADYRARDIVLDARQCPAFDLYVRGAKRGRVQLAVPGVHHVGNALAALAVALEAGVSFETAAASLASFTGAGRRFEVLYESGGITIADDYAHHPRELEVTLDAAMKMGYKRVVAVFQPFTFSRTHMLFDDFVRVLSIPDLVLLTPIMGSREINKWGVDSTQLAQQLPRCVCVETFADIADWIAANGQEGDLFLTLGCGDIYKAAKLTIQKLQK